jgi:hypothetical protein
MTALTAASPHGTISHGLPMPRLDTLTSGFTAVNGDSQNVTSFRPADIVRSPDDTEAIHVADKRQHLHSERPPTEPDHARQDHHFSYPPQSQAIDVRKRKRSDSAGGDSPQHINTNQPVVDSNEAKRRMTNIDSAVDLTSPEQSNHAQPAFPSELPSEAPTTDIVESSAR